MLAELFEWVMNLDPEFAFLLALPFAVALAGFLAEAVRSPRAKPRISGEKHAARAPRHTQTHVWGR
jgi:hypothetical protein